jgi:hypothetical protein
MSFMTPTTAPYRARRQASIADVRASLPSSDEMVDRIDAIFAQATEAEVTQGLGWYYQAHSLADEIGRRAGLDLEAGAGLMAALSPQCSWAENIARAWEAAETGAATGMGDQTRKAERILSDEDPGTVLGGRKVRSFYRNIVDPDQAGAVTVDRHAVSIVFGFSVDDRTVKVLERGGAYVLVASAYRTVARRHGMTPCQLQAVTWLVWRRLKGIVDDEWMEAF